MRNGHWELGMGNWFWWRASFPARATHDAGKRLGRAGNNEELGGQIEGGRWDGMGIWEYGRIGD